MDLTNLLAYFTTRTFRGKITLAYITLGFLILLLGTLSWVYVQRVSIDKYESIVTEQVPIRYYCGEINTAISQTTTHLNNYLLTKESNYKRQRQSSNWRFRNRFFLCIGFFCCGGFIFHIFQFRRFLFFC